MTASSAPSTSSGEQTVAVGELTLCCETFGAAGDPPLLLIMGLGAQMILWDDVFCEQLASRGFHVVRFDNRDIGRSSHLRGARVPRTWQLVTRDRRAAAYSLSDMAGDAAGLLDALGIAAAHVVGASMGGMIAQLLAIEHPARVLSLVSIMSTTGARRVGRPQPRLARNMLRPAARERSAYIEDHISTYRLIGSSEFDFEEDHKRARAERLFDRGINPAGSARQLAAIVTAPDRTPRLRQLALPATVIHGSADPLVDPSGGRATADAIPGAELLMLDGMGHDLPRELWPQIVDAITATATREPPRSAG